jgi:hypothetical protein
MKKLIVGGIVPVAAVLSLWVGMAGGTAGANTARHPNRPAVAHVTASRTATATSQQSATRNTSGATKASSEGDGNGENGSGENGNDGPGGHQDPPGNVNHECTGDCQE